MTDFQNYYRIYVQMKENLKGDFTYNYITKALADEDKDKDIHAGKMYSRVIDMDWVEAIEDTLPYIDKAIREQRRFIEQHEDIVPIEKARKITNESVRHLSQHTNLIARVEGDTVTPERILDIQREESFSIYENRFLITLVNNLIRFVEDRYRNLKDAPNDSYSRVEMKRKVVLNQQVLEFEVAYANESHERLNVDLNADLSTLTDFERVRRIRRILTDFMAAPLMRNLAKAEPVRPPILRTNLMTKNPNFKKALDLWLFIETYKKTGYDVVGKEYDGKMEAEIQEELYGVLTFQHFVMSIATNPAWKKLLHEKYLEENARREEEQSGTKDLERKKLEAFRIKQIREEEMKLRLEEIRSREKQISQLNSTVNSQKITIKQREDHIKELKGTLNLCEKTIKKQREDLVTLDKEVMTYKRQVAEKDKQIGVLQVDIDILNEKIDMCNLTIKELEEVTEPLKEEVERLTDKNRKLQDIFDVQKELLETLESNTAVLRAECAKYTDMVNDLEAVRKQQLGTIYEKEDKISELSLTLQDVREKLAEEELSYETQISDLEEKFKSEQEARKAEYENEIKKIIHNQKIAEEEAHKAYELREANYKSQINNIKLESEKKLLQLQQMNADNLEQIKRESKRQLEKAVSQEKHNTQKQIKFAKNAHELEIRAIRKEANSMVAKSKKLTKAVGSKLLDAYIGDSYLGLSGIQALQTAKFVEEGVSLQQITNNLLNCEKNMHALFLSVTSKGAFLVRYKNFKAVIYKKIEDDIDGCKLYISDYFKKENAQMAFISYFKVPKKDALDFADFLTKETYITKTMVGTSHGKNSGINKQFGIYYI